MNLNNNKEQQLNDKLPLVVGGDYDKERAEHIAKILGFEITDESMPLGTLHLFYNENGLFLKQDDLKMQGDFVNMLPRLKKSKVQSEMLYKASNIKGLEGEKTAIDATAGLGEDSILIAAAGYHVDLFEKNPIIAALLEDALYRASFVPELAGLVGQMELHTEDSIEYMKKLDKPVDLIYLDPMFPARQKTGLIKKKFQLLQKLECPEMNGEDMLKAAIGLIPKRIIVKRPLKGENLGGKKPSYSHAGKAIRYDCYINVSSM